MRPAGRGRSRRRRGVHPGPHLSRRARAGCPRVCLVRESDPRRLHRSDFRRCREPCWSPTTVAAERVRSPPQRAATVGTRMSRHEGPTRTSAPPKLPATLRLGIVHLTVTDLDRLVAFYEDAIGLRLHRREDGVAAMGVGEKQLLVLYEEPEARAGRHTGLYHYALLYPSRKELARAALRLAARPTPIQGASDHGTHEAIYLPDPDGNGIEL